MSSTNTPSPTLSAGFPNNNTNLADPGSGSKNPFDHFGNTHSLQATLLERIRMSGIKEQGSPPEEIHEEAMPMARVLFPEGSSAPKLSAATRATSGRNALKAISFASTSIERADLIGTDIVLSATDVRKTDIGLFLQFRSECLSPEDFMLRWSSKDDNFKLNLKNFEEKVQISSGSELHSLMESMFERIVSSKDTSVELAVRCLIDSMTRGIRNNSEYSDAVRKENMRGIQVMMFNDAYVQSGHEHYERVFRPGCVKRDIPVSDPVTQTRSNDLSTFPGHVRLSHSDDLIRADSWTWYFLDLMAYLCGPLQRNAINISVEKARYYCPQGRDKGLHGLHMTVDEDGTIMDVYDWFPLENQAFLRTQTVSTVVGIDISPNENERVGTALRAMDQDFREEWNTVFQESSKVPEDVVVPKGGYPVISFELMRTLMVDTQTKIRKDLSGKKAARAARVKKEDAERKKKSVGSGGFAKTDGKCRICKGDHTTTSCSKSTIVCEHFSKTGTCRFGDDCKGKHVKGGNTKKADTTSAAKPKPAGAPVEKHTTVGGKQQEKECRKQSVSSGCTKKFTLDMDYWDKKVSEDGWVLPEDCEMCRKEKRAQRTVRFTADEGSLFAGFEAGSEDDYAEADDDYFDGHSMSMSDAMLLTTDEPQQLRSSFQFESVVPSQCRNAEIDSQIDEMERELAAMGIYTGVDWGETTLMVAEDFESDLNSIVEAATPLPSDHARWEMRQRLRDNQYVPTLLKEAAELEAQASTHKPANPERVSEAGNKYSEQGFALLGDTVNLEIIEGAYDEAYAALVNESFAYSQNSVDSTDLALDNNDAVLDIDFVPIPEDSEDFWYPSSNSDEFELCLCDWNASAKVKDGECVHCEQCVHCCNCMEQHRLMLNETNADSSIFSFRETFDEPRSEIGIQPVRNFAESLPQSMRLPSSTAMACIQATSTRQPVICWGTQPVPASEQDFR
jgi:hypothetical protein